MRMILVQRNLNAIQESEILIRLLSEAKIPLELEDYRNLLIKICETIRQLAYQNLSRLELLDKIDVLEEVLSGTQIVTQYGRRLSEIYSSPVLRASEIDKLNLVIIRWLHNVHPRSNGYPPAVNNEGWSVLPLPFSASPIYFIPCLEQRSLLYQPLIFHEFGHVLYQFHEPEMNDLILELQQKILELLTPASQRNDRFAQRQRQGRQIIADTWYGWIIEFFCDAVGYTIGGPAFLYAFSSYLNTMQPGDFYRSREDLKNSAHPIKWLRIQFLMKRALKDGFTKVAQQIENEWCRVAKFIGIREDYYGFYDDILEAHVIGTIDDMVTEVEPRACLPKETAGNGWDPKSDSIIRLLNWTWQIRTEQPDEFSSWESEQIKLLLSKSFTYSK